MNDREAFITAVALTALAIVLALAVMWAIGFFAARALVA